MKYNAPTPIYDALVDGVADEPDAEHLALAQELHEVSHHAEDGMEFGGMTCDCIRRADRVLASRWLQTRLMRHMVAETAMRTRLTDWTYEAPPTHNTRATEGYWKAQADVGAILEGKEPE